MKYLPAWIAAAVLLLSFGTVWVGSRVREETVVAHPYESGQEFVAQAAAAHDHGHAAPPGAGAKAGCDLGAGPCTAGLEGGAELTAELSPRPPRAMTELGVSARLTRGGAPVEGAELEVSFAMADMNMGDNTVRLSGAGGGRYTGRAVLVRCQSGRREWLATFRVREAGREVRTALPVRLGE